jgi:hypothetical protein
LEEKRGEGGGDPCLGALEYFGRHRSRQKRSGDVLVERRRNMGKRAIVSFVV